jgi:hypothetical protein
MTDKDTPEQAEGKPSDEEQDNPEEKESSQDYPPSADYKPEYIEKDENTVLGGKGDGSPIDPAAQSRAVLADMEETNLANTSKLKNELVVALLDCDAMRHPGTRQTIIDELPDNIKNHIRYSSVDKEHINNIVKRCLKIADGVSKLLEAVHFLDGDTIGLQRAQDVYQKIINSPQVLLERVQTPSPDDPLWKHVEHWFENELVTEHQKFYAVTLSMFNGLKYPDFKHIYELILQVMEVDDAKGEEEEEKPRSHFRRRDDKLIKLVKAKLYPSEDGMEHYLAFEERQYATTLLDLMRRWYPSLLLDLLPALKQIVEQYSYWDIRSRAALTVAEIGKIGFQQVRVRVLEPWASNLHRSYIRASVGYPLARLSEDETTRAAVENLLDDWSDENWNRRGETWTYRWAAASTYKQIGALEIDEGTWPMDWAHQGLTKLAGFNDRRIADAVIHSLVVLSLQGQLERVLLTIKAWIEGGSAGDKDNAIPRTRCIVGIWAFLVLSEIHIELATEEKDEAQEADVDIGNLFELVCQSESEKSEYWELMVAVGLRSFEYKFGSRSLSNDFLDLIGRWTKYAADEPILQNVVRNLLVDVFFQVHLPLRRDHILNRLTRWQKYSKNRHLKEMASSAKEKIKEKI